MALLKFKRSAVPAKVPAINDLDLGELAINTYDGKVYTKKDDGTPAIVEVGGTASTTSTLLMPVRNNTGATLTKGTAVYINGALGQNSTVAKAIATSDATSAQTLGIITADLPNNTVGNVTLIGTITNINTSAYTDGQQLYLSPTTAGGLTATKPYAPNHLVYMAVVEHAHPTQGKLFVKVQNGYEMDELHDVSAQNPANNDGLFYNTTSGLWEKKSIVTALGYTPYNATNPAGYITSSALSSYLPLSGGTLTGNLILANGANRIVRIGSATNYSYDLQTVGDDFQIIEAGVTPRLTIKYPSGDVGIGTTSPTNKLSISATGLDITGGNAINGTNMQGIRLQNTLNDNSSLGLWFGTNNVHWAGISGQRTNFAGDWTTDLRFYTHEAALVDVTHARERMRIAGNGSVTANVDFRAPLFYDSENTARFVDPSSTSVLNVIRGTTLQHSSGQVAVRLNGDTWTEFCDPNGATKLWLGGGDPNNYYNAGIHYFRNTSSGTTMTIDNAGNAIATASYRAPIFYDTNDTSRYLDPNGTSRINFLTLLNDEGLNVGGIRGLFSAGSDGQGISLFSNVDIGYPSGWGAGLGNTPSRGLSVYGGLRVAYSGTGFVTSDTSVRSPIFYDSNNTAYYVDPNAGSNVFGEFSVNQNGAGGIRLISTTGTQSLWIRTGYDGAPTPSVSATNVQFQSSGSSAGSFTFWSGNTLSLTIAGDHATGNGSLRAPIFYDSGNTGYYVDPNYISQFWRINAADYIYTSSDVYGKRFIDIDNQGYFVDPASTSYLNTLSTREDIGSGTATAFVYSAPNLFYYWTRIANVGGGDASATILITSKGDTNYVNFASALLTISAWNGTNSSAKLEAISGCDTGMDVRIDNNNDVWLQVASPWSSNLSWKVINKVGSPTVYYTSLTQQTTTPANSANITYGQTMRGTQGAMSSASVTNIVNTILGGLTARSDARAPIFYDSNDTGYYIDPNDTSFTNGMRSNVYRSLYGGGQPAARWDCSFYVLQSQHWYSHNGASTMYVGESGDFVYIRGYTTADGSSRSPIFYDSNDTGYYLDPNTTGLSLRVNGNLECFARSAAWSEGLRVRVPTRGTWGGIRFTRDEGNANGNWAIGFTGIDSTDDLTFWGNVGGGEGMRARLTQSGNFTATGNVTAYSDGRLKQDVQTVENALDLVSQMRGVTYTRKDNGEAGVGVIAQEMREIMPQVVQQDGGEDGTLSVAYGNLVGVLIEAIKELSLKVKTLEEKDNSK
jgi:hypothetical protein